jgi:uncharacterized membrane protein
LLVGIKKSSPVVRKFLHECIDFNAGLKNRSSRLLYNSGPCHTYRMENLSWHKEIIEIFKIALVLVTGIVILPLIIGFFDNIAVTKVLGLIVSILIFQPFAVVIGLGLGFHALPLMLIMCSMGLSVILGLLRICDMFAYRSEWLSRHLEKVEAFTQKSRVFKKYGMISHIPLIWVPGVGLYGCVMIAWLFRWRSILAITMIFAAWMFAALIVLLTSMGILAFIQ